MKTSMEERKVHIQESVPNMELAEINELSPQELKRLVDVLDGGLEIVLHASGPKDTEGSLDAQAASYVIKRFTDGAYQESVSSEAIQATNQTSIYLDFPTEIGGSVMNNENSFSFSDTADGQIDKSTAELVFVALQEATHLDLKDYEDTEFAPASLEERFEDPAELFNLLMFAGEITKHLHGHHHISERELFGSIEGKNVYSLDKLTASKNSDKWKVGSWANSWHALVGRVPNSFIIYLLTADKFNQNIKGDIIKAAKEFLADNPDLDEEIQNVRNLKNILKTLKISQRETKKSLLQLKELAENHQEETLLGKTLLVYPAEKKPIKVRFPLRAAGFDSMVQIYEEGHSVNNLRINGGDPEALSGLAEEIQSHYPEAKVVLVRKTMLSVDFSDVKERISADVIMEAIEANEQLEKAGDWQSMLEKIRGSRA